MLTRCSCMFFLAVLTGGCFQHDKAKISEILPPDYSSSYVLARNCRYSTSHARFLKVLTDRRETNDAYLAGNRVLPPNSLVVAEEYEGSSCSTLMGYTVMNKVSGYDPGHNDWRWQKLDDVRNTLEDGRVQTCIDCHLKCSQIATPEYTCWR